MAERQGENSVKKKKKAMDEVVVSNQFLVDLLAPFLPMEKIFDFVVDGSTGKIHIFYKKGGVKNTT